MLYYAKTGLPWIMQWTYRIDKGDLFPLFIRVISVKLWDRFDVDTFLQRQRIKTEFPSSSKPNSSKSYK